VAAVQVQGIYAFGTDIKMSVKRNVAFVGAPLGAFAEHPLWDRK